MISIWIQGRPFNITVIQVYAPTTSAEEAEINQFYEDLQHLLELTPKKDILVIIGDWNAEVGSPEMSTHGHHQMGNTEIRLMIFSAAKDGEALYSKQKQDLYVIVIICFL